MPKKRTHPCNTVEVERRTNLMLKWISAGFIGEELLSLAREDGWGLTDAGVGHYIHRANKILKAEASIDRERELGLAARRYTNIYKRCMTRDDFQTALRANKELAGLFGLNKLEIDVNGKMEHEHNVNSEEAGRIFDILAESGIIRTEPDEAEDDEVHTA